MPAPQRILLRSGKSPFEPLSAEAVMRRKIGGANLGNLVFSDSVHKMLMVDGAEVISTRFNVGPADADRINGEYDVFVMPFANAFRKDFQASLRMWTQLIRRLKIPVSVIGIGAQSNLDRELGPLEPINADVKEFVGAVLDKSPSIGVRGEFTGEYLKSLGFSDVEVIGCPSLFRYGADLKVEKERTTLDGDARIAVSMTAGTDGDLPGIVKTNAQRYPNLIYTAQDIKDLELMYWGDTSEAAGRFNDYPRNRTHYLFRENRVRVFLDPVTWISGLAEQDFVFGSRIHGSITALLGGTPSVVLGHDSRTQELCEYFEIPHRRLVDLPSGTDAAQLYEEADFSSLVGGHAERFARMTAFLDKHGLDHVYAPGRDGGSAFEQRLRELDFPPAVEAWSDDDGALGYRMGWLKESVTDLRKDAAKAQKQIAALQKQVAELKEQSASGGKLAARVTALENSLYRRVRRKLGRVGRRSVRG